MVKIHSDIAKNWTITNRLGNIKKIFLSKFNTWTNFKFCHCCCCSFAKLCPTLCNHTNCMQQASLPFPSISPWICSNSCPLSWWCHPPISPSVTPFSSCLQSFPMSGSFPMSWVFSWGGQNIRASASAPVLPVNIQDWFPLGLNGSISLLPKWFPRVFSSTLWKHQFFNAQPSLWSNFHIHAWLLEKP